MPCVGAKEWCSWWFIHSFSSLFLLALNGTYLGAICSHERELSLLHTCQTLALWGLHQRQWPGCDLKTLPFGIVTMNDLRNETYPTPIAQQRAVTCQVAPPKEPCVKDVGGQQLRESQQNECFFSRLQNSSSWEFNESWFRFVTSWGRAWFYGSDLCTSVLSLSQTG